MRYKRIYFSTLLALTSCSGHSAGWHDSLYEDIMETAQGFFAEGHPDQAEHKYKAALRQALLADRPEAIHDAGFNLALAQLQQGHDRQALKSLAEIQTALERRSWKKQNDLVLIRATVLYHQRQWDAAQNAAQQAQQTREASIRFQAIALSGLIALEQNDQSVLCSAMEALRASSDFDDVINLLELRTGAALLAHHWEQACDLAVFLVKKRQEAVDYAGMRRALSLQIRALEGAGHYGAAQELRQERHDSLHAE